MIFYHASHFAAFEITGISNGLSKNVEKAKKTVVLQKIRAIVVEGKKWIINILITLIILNIINNIIQSISD